MIPAAFAAFFSHLPMRPSGPVSVAFLAEFAPEGATSIPTWLASMLAMTCAVLGAVLAVLDRSRRGRWLGVSVIFGVLSIDEIASLHRGVRALLRSLFGYASPMRSWLPALILAALVAAVYLPFVWRLDPKVRRSMFMAGLVFLAGALVLDVAGGFFRHVFGSDGFGYPLLTTLEVLFELTGLALFAYALALAVERFDLLLVAGPISQGEISPHDEDTLAPPSNSPDAD
jgi:hypothetical protein